jgi:hypothetical protein
MCKQISSIIKSNIVSLHQIKNKTAVVRTQKYLCMIKSLFIMLLMLLTGGLSIFSQVKPAIIRPKITGVAHIALYVKSIDQARAFYEVFLGFAEPYSL